MLLDARARGRGATFKAFLRLSGPGWLQSGITLGGGSLSSCLYLGTLVGFSFLWLQPIAMILGIVMLSAIAYVALSTGRRPFGAINEHVNPALGWGWLLAAMMANMIWSMPQFGLGIAAIRQNLLPGLLGPMRCRRCGAKSSRPAASWPARRPDRCSTVSAGGASGPLRCWSAAS